MNLLQNLEAERDKLIQAAKENHKKAMQQVANLRLLTIDLEDGLNKSHQATIDSITQLLGKPSTDKQDKPADQGNSNQADYEVVEE